MAMTFDQKIAQLNQMRRKLRADIIEKMKTNPTMKDSETLRLVYNDISFWESQTDHSPNGLMATLNASLKNGIEAPLAS